MKRGWEEVLNFSPDASLSIEDNLKDRFEINGIYMIKIISDKAAFFAPEGGIWIAQLKV